MRLSCQAFLLLAAATIACGEPFTPSTVSGFYVLESVNGQPLPAIIGTISEGTITVLEGSVTLTSDENAYTFERRREVRQNVPSEHINSSRHRFELDGTKISFIIDCPPDAICVLLEGLKFGDKLSIAVGGFSFPNAMIYEYRLAPSPIVPAG